MDHARPVSDWCIPVDTISQGCDERRAAGRAHFQIVRKRIAEQVQLDGFTARSKVLHDGKNSPVRRNKKVRR